MIEAFEALREQFHTFGTSSISLALAGAALLFCMAQREKLRGGAKNLTQYGILFFLLLANPFGYQIIYSFWMEEYWKMFMVVLPFVFVAFAATQLAAGLKSFWKGAVMGVCCMGVIAAGSFFAFDERPMQAVRDRKEQEREIAAVDEIIRTSGIAPQNMIAPREVCGLIREVNPEVKLMYGEALIDKMVDKTLQFEDEEKQKFVDLCTTIVAVPSAIEYQILAADLYGGNCILLETEYEDAGQLAQAGFVCVERTEKYAVYFRE